MRVWLLSNPLLGHKNNSKEFIDMSFGYLEGTFLPTLRGKFSKGDVVVIAGGLFANPDLISTVVAHRLTLLVNDIVTVTGELYFIPDECDISTGGCGVSLFIESLKGVAVVNKACFIDNDVTLASYQCEGGLNSKFVIRTGDLVDGSSQLTIIGGRVKKVDGTVTYLCPPYQLDGASDEVGFHVLDTMTGQLHFSRNKVSPVYKLMEVNTMKDLEDIDQAFVEKNRVSVKINRSLLLESEVKVNILLSRYKFIKVEFTGGETSGQAFDSGLSVKQMLIEKVKSSCSAEAVEEFNKILDSYK